MNKKYALVAAIILVLASILIIMVHAQGLSVSISPPQPATINLHQSELYTANPSGGQSPYYFQWYYNNTKPPSGGTSQSWTFTPNSTGYYTISVKCNDSETPSESASAPIGLTVHTALQVTISPTSATIDLGQSKNFTATASGGTPTYNYSWEVNRESNWTISSTNPTWTFKPSSAGSYNITCQATDKSNPSGNTAWPRKTVPVSVSPSLVVNISPTSETMDVGQSQTFTSSIVGGTPQYAYQWYLNGAAQGTGSSWTFTSSSSGSYSVYVNVTDSVNFRAKSNVVTVTVNVVPSVSTSPYTKTWVPNLPLTFTESVTGGTSPYTYYWGCGQSISQAYINMGNNGPTTSNTWTFTFNTLGNWIVVCNVFDSAKGTPVLGPWGSTAYVTVSNYSLLQLSANCTVPNLTFKVSNGTGTLYSGGPGALALSAGKYNVTVSPTLLVVSSKGTIKIVVTYQFVGWANVTQANPPIISTNDPITITLPPNTTLTLIACYTVTVSGNVQ